MNVINYLAIELRSFKKGNNGKLRMNKRNKHNEYKKIKIKIFIKFYVNLFLMFNFRAQILYLIS